LKSVIQKSSEWNEVEQVRRPPTQTVNYLQYYYNVIVYLYIVDQI